MFWVIMAIKLSICSELRVCFDCSSSSLLWSKRYAWHQAFGLYFWLLAITALKLFVTFDLPHSILDFSTGNITCDFRYQALALFLCHIEKSVSGLGRRLYCEWMLRFLFTHLTVLTWSSHLTRSCSFSFAVEDISKTGDDFLDGERPALVRFTNYSITVTWIYNGLFHLIPVHLPYGWAVRKI